MQAVLWIAVLAAGGIVDSAGARPQAELEWFEREGIRLRPGPFWIENTPAAGEGEGQSSGGGARPGPRCLAIWSAPDLQAHLVLAAGPPAPGLARLRSESILRALRGAVAESVRVLRVTPSSLGGRPALSVRSRARSGTVVLDQEHLVVDAGSALLVLSVSSPPETFAEARRRFREAAATLRIPDSRPPLGRPYWLLGAAGGFGAALALAQRKRRNLRRVPAARSPRSASRKRLLPV